MKVFYFGCYGNAGHYMRAPGGSALRSTRAEHDFTISNPWGYNIDGELCVSPERRQVQGVTKVHHKDGWTAISFWDRSVDSRPGSNSALLAEGEHTFEGMMALFNHYFPEVLKRYKFPIVEVQSPA